MFYAVMTFRDMIYQLEVVDFESTIYEQNESPSSVIKRSGKHE